MPGTRIWGPCNAAGPPWSVSEGMVSVLAKCTDHPTSTMETGARISATMSAMVQAKEKWTPAGGGASGSVAGVMRARSWASRGTAVVMYEYPVAGGG